MTFYLKFFNFCVETYFLSLIKDFFTVLKNLIYSYEKFNNLKKFFFNKLLKFNNFF